MIMFLLYYLRKIGKMVLKNQGLVFIVILQAKDFIDLENSKDAFKRPQNELCFIHDIYSLASIANAHQQLKEPITIEKYIRVTIAKIIVDSLENISDHYRKELSFKYDVWKFNNIEFPKKSLPVKLSLNESIEKVSLLKNFINNQFINIKPLRIDYPKITQIMDYNDYRQIKDNCVTHYENFNEFEIDLKKLKLSQSDIRDTIKEILTALHKY